LRVNLKHPALTTLLTRAQITLTQGIQVTLYWPTMQKARDKVGEVQLIDCGKHGRQQVRHYHKFK